MKYQAVTLDEEVWTFIASLDTNGEKPCMTYDLARNGERVRLLTDVPSEIVAQYGVFIGRVQHWEQGGKLHESLRHND